jgi:hypothetical protein
MNDNESKRSAAKIKTKAEHNFKNTVFWDATPCSLVDNYELFGVACCLHLLGYGGSKLPRKLRKYLPNYTPSHTRTTITNMAVLTDNAAFIQFAVLT